MLHAEAFLSSTRIACGFFSMRIKPVEGSPSTGFAFYHDIVSNTITMLTICYPL